MTELARVLSSLGHKSPPRSRKPYLFHTPIHNDTLSICSEELVSVFADTEK